ncbi:hypothetical protein BDV27DRAFT_153833 [Aspergillus caelatus]|uniref:Uncharacterized protein n=2 Tax=Aspergillus subgen. Circumdati TaxID=2720871 RepID=A0A5N7AFZ6_9EURO|nr:uncharacterized protein BDV27DRAFT_153833 [Aspergillus caelatus]KAE8368635.1 hypothetical protein BDV27DRAFT_153833 [Aspergillus caelatus]KAE8418484.1 hypothetical protein BDV36DRAFT_295125 [Aspergillus pseudocaelatus]
MGGVPLNTFKQIKESLKSIFKRKKKGDKNNAQAAEQKPEDTIAAGAGAATTEATTTHEAPATESQDAAPTATGPPQSTPGISPGTSIPEQGQHNDHEVPTPTPLPQIPPIETTESAAPAETPAAQPTAGLAVGTAPEPAKPEAK